MGKYKYSTPSPQRLREAVPPHHLDAEIAVLGALLHDPATALPQVQQQLQASHFYQQAHRKIYEACLTIAQKGDPITLISVEQQLQSQGYLEDVGGVVYLFELTDAVPTAANVAYHARIVKEKANLRRLQELGLRLHAEASNGGDPQAILDNLTQFLREQEPMRSSSRLPVEEAVAFLQQEVATGEEVIGGNLLPSGGVLIIGGGPKRGKTLLAINLGLALATGGPFLSCFPIPQRRRVLMIQQEVGAASMQDRLKRMVDALTWGSLDPGWFYLSNVKGLRLHASSHRERLEDVIQRVQPEVLILDPLARFHTLNENRAEDMGLLFTVLDELRTRYNLAIILVHHHGKPQKDDVKEGGHLLRGSSAIFDWGDSYLTLDRRGLKKPGEYTKLNFELRHGENPVPLLLYRNPSTLWWEVVVDAGEEAPSSPEVVAKALGWLGGEAWREELETVLMTNLKCKDRTARAHIYQATQGGFLEQVWRPGQGSKARYRLTPVGQAVAEILPGKGGA